MKRLVDSVTKMAPTPSRLRFRFVRFSAASIGLALVLSLLNFAVSTTQGTGTAAVASSSSTSPLISGNQTFYVYMKRGEHLNVEFRKYRQKSSDMPWDVKNMDKYNLVDTTFSIRGAGITEESCVITPNSSTGTRCRWSSLIAQEDGVVEVSMTPAGSSPNWPRVGIMFSWYIYASDHEGRVHAGRVWSNLFRAAHFQDPEGLTGQSFWLYYLTPQGYVYAAGYINYNGIYSNLIASKKGVILNSTGNSAYKSVNQSDAGAGNTYSTIGANNKPFLTFFEMPSGDLPSTATLPNGTSITLSNFLSPLVPTFTNVSSVFNPGSDTATFTWTQANTENNRTLIDIDTNGNGSFTDAVDVRNVVTTHNDGTHSYVWNMRQGDANGAPNGARVANTGGAIVFRVSTDREGEIHLTNTDVEKRGGLRVVLQNPDAHLGLSPALSASRRNRIFWNDTGLSTAGRQVTNNRDGTAGVDSTSYVHNLPSTGDGTTDGWGNARIIDDWAYVSTRRSGVVTLNAATRCPVYNSGAAVSDPSRWVVPSRSNGIIPIANNSSDTARGNYCFSRSTIDNYTRYLNLTVPIGTDLKPYEWRCVTTKQSVQGQPTTFTAQTASIKTPVGTLFDSALGSGTAPSAAAIAAAEANVNTADGCTIELNANNETSFAEGGVMDTVEFTTLATLNSSAGSVQRYTCTKNTPFVFRLSVAGAASMAPGTPDNLCGAAAALSPTPTEGWVASGAPTNSSVMTLQVQQTPQVTNYLQSLSVHGNSGDFGLGFKDALLSQNFHNTSVTDINNGDTSKYYSGSATTSKINSRTVGSVIQPPTNFPVWGNGASDPRGTNSTGFFDKEVAFEGKLTKPAPTASVVMSRDNNFRKMNFARYHVNYGGVVKEREDLVGVNSDAVTTTITRWINGTPTLKGENNDVGALKVWEEGSWDILTSNSGQGALQTNWSNSTGKYKTWGQINSDFDHIMVAASWASEKARPQVFSVRWEYEALVSNVLTSTVGFGPNRQAKYTTKEISVPVQGKVQGRSDGAKISPALHEQQERFTGTGSVNNFDGVMYWGTNLDNNKRWRVAPSVHSPYYYSLQFTRVTGE